jgi:hypothetical protein
VIAQGLGTLCTNHRAVCSCGLGRSAALQILATAAAIAAFCALQPIPIRSAHLPLDSCRGSLAQTAHPKHPRGSGSRSRPILPRDRTQALTTVREFATVHFDPASFSNPHAPSTIHQGQAAASLHPSALHLFCPLRNRRDLVTCACFPLKTNDQPPLTCKKA